MQKKCSTHHYACDCREAQMRGLKDSAQGVYDIVKGMALFKDNYIKVQALKCSLDTFRAS